MIGARAPVPVPPLLSFPSAPAARLPDGSALLIYSSNQCCLSLFCTTSTLVPHLSNPTFLPIFFTAFPTTLFLFILSFCRLLHNSGLKGKKKNPDRTQEKQERRDGRNGCGRGNRAFDFSLEVPPYFNIGFNRALMP